MASVNEVFDEAFSNCDVLLSSLEQMRGKQYY